MFEIEKHKHEIMKICQELRVRFLDVVGSAARDDFEAERSDIDVLIDFDDSDRLFDRYFELKERLEALFGRPVDVIQNKAVNNPYVRQSLDRSKVRIYGS